MVFVGYLDLGGEGLGEGGICWERNSGCRFGREFGVGLLPFWEGLGWEGVVGLTCIQWGMVDEGLDLGLVLEV